MTTIYSPLIATPSLQVVKADGVCQFRIPLPPNCDLAAIQVNAFLDGDAPHIDVLVEPSEQGIADHGGSVEKFCEWFGRRGNPTGLLSGIVIHRAAHEPFFTRGGRNIITYFIENIPIAGRAKNNMAPLVQHFHMPQAHADAVEELFKVLQGNFLTTANPMQISLLSKVRGKLEMLYEGPDGGRSALLQ